MTVEPDLAIEMLPQGQASLSCVVDSPDLLRVRILPAQFARALGVSKQSVSRWVRGGWVTLGADGRLDPTVAIGQLLRRCDPGRLRARWLRQAVGEVQGLRDSLAEAEDRAEAAEAALGEAIDRAHFWQKWALDGDRSVEIFRALLVEQADRLRAAPTGEWPAIIEELLDDAIIAADDAQPDPAALRELSAAEGGGGE